MSRDNIKTTDMIMNQWKKLQIDNRVSEDIVDTIKDLAASYTPEWHMDETNPDIGGAIAMIYADHMEENIDRINQVLENYHTEFVNLLDISPKSAQPAEGVISFSTSIDTIPGTYIAKGTKLSADKGEEPLVFETQHGLYVTSSSLSGIYMVDGEDGLIQPLKGQFTKPSLLPKKQPGEAEEEVEGLEESTPAVDENQEDEHNVNVLKPFRLFGETNTITQNICVFYLGAVVNSFDNPVYVRIEGNEKLIKKIQEKEFIFKWYGEDGLSIFDFVQLQEDGKTFILQNMNNQKIGKLQIGAEEYHVIALEAVNPVTESYKVDSVRFCSKGRLLPIDFATNGNVDYDSQSFDMFGDTLSPFLACYVGMENYFAQTGATIHMEFDVSFRTHEIDVSKEEIEQSLKIIKRKPKKPMTNLAADCFVEEISIEYFNGYGWKKLETKAPVMTLFAEEKKGKYTIDFECPVDWTSVDVGAYSGRMLKIQLLKADNCYMRPCIHHYPHIENWKVEYSYEGKYMTPAKVRGITGTTLMDYSKPAMEDRAYHIFNRTPYNFDSLYLGFTRKLENGPIGILFEIENEFHCDGIKCNFEYSTTDGFKPMKVIDHTGNFSHTGTVSFLPPPDMKRRSLENKNLYWIRIVRRKSVTSERRNALPFVRDIKLNVVEIANINTLPVRDLYINEALPDPVIHLNTNNILDVDVWVNEIGFISRAELLSIQEENPEKVDISYDSFGNMISCFLKYEECDSFHVANDRRVYILDRINGEILFGNGIQHNIPKVVSGVAMRVRIRQSMGGQANLEANEINGSVGNLLYIDEIRNPLKLYGGSNMEDFGNALARGAYLLQSRNRVVSEADYKKEIMLYSDTVADVKVICEDLRNGDSNPLAVSCVLLLKDYEIGKEAFFSIAKNVKRHLLSFAEITIQPEYLHIVEPIFVDISVDIWAESLYADESFEIQNSLRQLLDDYLSPVDHWKIGTLPKESQIMMRLNAMKNLAIIKKTVITAKYTDESGVHEVDLSQIKISPYMICRSGEHNVHIILTQGEN